MLVALGIGASRLAGLGRETVASRLLGNTAAGDAFAVAMRIPNMLQNLLGEGVLSASFVPVYSRLIDEAGRDGDDPVEPGQVAGAVAAALAAVVGLAVLAVCTLARPITFVLAPGLDGERFELAVELVRITAVGTGFAVLSAWCLGVLNSHRRFFLSYAAPVLWNVVQVAALVVAWILAFDLDGVARAMAWGVAGGGAGATPRAAAADAAPGAGAAAALDPRPPRAARGPQPLRPRRARARRAAGVGVLRPAAGLAARHRRGGGVVPGADALHAAGESSSR